MNSLSWVSSQFPSNPIPRLHCGSFLAQLS
jgi:hypothetical protein